MHGVQCATQVQGHHAGAPASETTNISMSDYQVWWLVTAVGCTSLPFWLPPLVVRLRNRAFVAINGAEGMELPSSEHGGMAGMEFLYSHSAANLRLRQPSVGLSDLFAYFLSPAHEIHQEHVETAHPHYARVASASRSVLGVPKTQLRELARKHVTALLQADPSTALLRQRGWQAVRLEELLFVAFTRLMYELVFREPPTVEAEQLVLDGGTNVIRTLKWTAQRDTAARDRLTAHVEEKLAAGCCDWIDFDPALSIRERALYIQGVHLVTGVVQLSEGMAHLFVALAQHPHPRPADAGTSPAAVADYLDRAITESLRRWPLFGIAHRITSEPITVPITGEVIPANTVLCFNFERYQNDPETFDRPKSFEPSRWIGAAGAAAAVDGALDKRKVSSYIPFGVAANRPCPAQRMSLVIMNEAVSAAGTADSLARSRAFHCTMSLIS